MKESKFDSCKGSSTFPSGEQNNARVEAVFGMGPLRIHARRLWTEFLNRCLNHDGVLKLIGSANGKLGLIASVFLAYPATQEFSDAYTYPFRARLMDWNPGPVGFFWMGGKIGIEFTVSNRDAEFVDPANAEKLRKLVARVKEIQGLLRAEHVTFAGTLPGILLRNRIVREMPEAGVTAEIVAQAVRQVIDLEKMPRDTPVIVLGGRGFIGRKVVALLPRETVHCVDIKNEQDEWPSHLRGKPAVLVNISTHRALESRLQDLWPEMVLVNEVYPEPPHHLLVRLRDIGCRGYHVVGVKALSLPLFPGAYGGGIPCCAAWKTPHLQALLAKIV
jgi:hypothetical protein